VSTSTAEVRRTNLQEREFSTGALGFSGTYSVLASGSGTLTWLPPIDTVVKQGDPVYEVDGTGVTLMYGSRPAWRDFTLGMTDGIDVQELETDLQQLGYGSGLTVDQHFTTATYNAIRQWQAAKHVTVTGSVPLGTITFQPGAIRVSGHDLAVGEQIHPGAKVEHATSDQPTVNLQASTQLGWIKVNDSVVVTLPDGQTRNGKVSSIGATTTTSGNQSQNTVAVTVTLDGQATGFVDQASVQVWIVRATHPNVLAVPITALNSVSGGQYEVILVDGATTRRLLVQVGLFDNLSGLAEVSGDGLSEGQKVQVPSEDQ
jgi:peptidoglycan hydrolase-like protein with peptidoglycan-binding domain